MPKEFDECVRKGGKVRTETLSGNRYRHVCYPKGGGKPVKGYVKVKKGSKKGK